jgi:hypothetical protein
MKPVARYFGESAQAKDPCLMAYMCEHKLLPNLRAA